MSIEKKVLFGLLLKITLLCIIVVGANELSAQNIIASGIVKNGITGLPLEGVTVTLNKSTKKTITDIAGKFSLSVPKKGALLTFSYIGFSTMTKSVENSLSLEIVLQETKETLDEVVVIGYGTVKKKDATGAVAKVNLTDLNKAPVRSFDEALAGRIAGVTVASNDGQPGASVNIVIRGNNSLTQDNSPLYVIDGFPIENPNNNVLNPNDIESMEILKDASATAIYGARGANGVIIITTKKGKVSIPTLSFDAYYGTQKDTKRMALMSAYEYVKYQFERSPATTASTFFTNGQSLESYKNRAGVDWQDLLLRKAAIQNYNLSISGGNATTKYAISGSAFKQDGNIINSDYSRYQGRMVLDQTVNNKCKIGFNINYSNLVSNGAAPSYSGFSNTLGLMYSVWGYRPTSGDSTNSGLLGGLFDSSVSVLNDYRSNPIINTKNTLNKRTTNVFVANFYADYTLTKDLRLRITGGVNRSLQKGEVFYNSNTSRGNVKSPLGSNGPNGTVNFTSVNNWLNENTLSYNKTISAKHQINAVIGATFQGTTNESNGYGAIQVPNDELGISSLGGGIPLSVASSNSENTLASFLGRVNYTLHKNYLFTVSYRADGSSKFLKKWSYFPSAAFAWKITDENFAQKWQNLIEAKLRTSYGVVGNNRVSDYPYQYTISAPIAASYPFNNSYVRGSYPNSLGNRNLKWETTYQGDLGLDIGFFRHRIDVQLDYYQKNTKDLLLDARLRPSSGYENAYKNIGEVKNSGFEFSINTLNVKNTRFIWSTTFNISFNKSKVIALAQNQETLLSTVYWNGPTDPLYMAMIGKPISQIIGYVWEGVYQLNDFDKAGSKYVLKDNVPYTVNGKNAIQPGDIKYKDINGDGIVDNNDVTTIGNPYPKHVGGIGNNFTYGNFDLNLFFQWSSGNDLVNINRLIFEGNQNNSSNLNQFASYTNRWSLTNQNTNVFRTNGAGPSGIYSTRIIEDGSYLRFKTVQVGYNVPSSKYKKLGVRSIRVYASAQNLYTWTKYSGLDPEVSVYQSALTPGSDYSSYPRARTITLGLNVNF